MNNIMTAAELKDDIKFGLGGIYLFFGEEEYMKQHYPCSWAAAKALQKASEEP